MQQALLSAADVPRGQHKPDVFQGPTSGAGAGLLYLNCPSAVLSLALTSYLPSIWKGGKSEKLQRTQPHQQATLIKALQLVKLKKNNKPNRKKKQQQTTKSTKQKSQTYGKHPNSVELQKEH